MKIRALAFGLLLLLVACRHNPPRSYNFMGCVVQRAWIDEKGNQRRDCNCKNGRQIGIDAKTKAAVIRCE